MLSMSARLTPARTNAFAAWWGTAPDGLTLPELCAWLADTYDAAALAAAKFDDEPSRLMLALAVERAELLRGGAVLLEASDSLDRGDRISQARFMSDGLRGGFIEHLKRVGRRELARAVWRNKRDALMSEAEQAGPPEPPLALCPQCEKTGRDPDDGETCDLCHGQGDIEADRADRYNDGKAEMMQAEEDRRAELASGG